MDTGSKAIVLSPRDRFKARGLLLDYWRTLEPVRGLVFLVSFYLAVSLGYIIFFSESFNYGKRIIVLHASIICGLIIVTMACLGSLFLIKGFREWRFARVVLSLLPATAFSALVTLYFANYVANSMWGNNITYELVAQYIFGRGIFQKELQLLPGRTYLVWVAVLVFIFSVHLGLRGHLFRSLEELIVPSSKLRTFRDRRRLLALCAGILLSLLLVSVIAYQSTRTEMHYRAKILTHEPILGLFIDAKGFIDLTDVRKNLMAEEEEIRARYATEKSFEKKNVVIIMVDSLRADHMQVYGYERPTTPFLTSLLKTGNLKQVEIATSTCSDTNCGVLSTLSSHTLGRQTPQNFKLQDLLYDQGYRVYFVLSSNHSWYSLKKSYGTSLTYFFDGTKSSKYQWSDDRVIFEGLEKVPDFTGTAAFLYFHLMSAHPAGVKQEEYLQYQPAKNWVEFREGEYDALAATNYYDNGVLQADAMIKTIWESLRQKGYLDNSLIIILSDHGEGLGQSDRSLYGHVNYLYQDCIRIPLLIYDDDPKAKYADLKYATQIDVAPTIVARLGLDIPSSWQGQSLLTANTKRYSFHQTATSNPSYAVIYRDDHAIYKYIQHYGLGEALYELIKDPNEKHNLIGTAEPTLVEHMREKLAERLSDD